MNPIATSFEATLTGTLFLFLAAYGALSLVLDAWRSLRLRKGRDA